MPGSARPGSHPGGSSLRAPRAHEENAATGGATTQACLCAPEPSAAVRKIGPAIVSAVTKLTRVGSRRGRSTAIHEAGHAVLYIALALGCERVTIVPDHKNHEAGSASHGGEWGRAAQSPGEKDDA